jgi:hypothetical protein
MLNSIFTKKIEKTNVILIPTGNNIARYGDTNPFSQAENATIVKVTKKFVVFTFENSTFEQKKRISEHSYNELKGDNSGYIVYLNQKELNDAIVLSKVQNKFRDHSTLTDMTPEQAVAIADIMKFDF